MPLATGPTLSCSSGYAPVAVIASDKVLPIQNAKVTLLSTYSIMGVVLDSKRHDLTTNAMGLAEVCEANRLSKSYAVEAWIQKSKVDFGSGYGEPHRVGSVTGLGRYLTPITIFKTIARTIPYKLPPVEPITPPISLLSPTLPPTLPEPPVELPKVCTAWNTVVTPNVPATLSASFPITVSGAKWECKDFAASELINGMGKIEFEGRTFDIPIQNGYGRVNLGDLIDLSGSTGLPTVTTVPTVPSIPSYISPLAPGSTTVTLYLNEYLRKGILTPARGGKWGAGNFSRSGEYYNIHYVGNGYDGSIGIPCRLNKPKTHRYFGDYTVTVLSVQNLGLDNASYTVKIKL